MDAIAGFAFDGKEQAFDVVYPALGALPRSELASSNWGLIATRKAG
jgi:hypothetical protein